MASSRESSSSSSLAVVLVAAVVLLLAGRGAAQSSSAPAPAPSSGSCLTEMVSLYPCLSYTSGNRSTPSTSCCSALSSVVASNPRCLCKVLAGGASSLGVTVNSTKALELPAACNVKTPLASACNSVGAPVPSSPTSPATTTPSSPTTPASPSAPASVPAAPAATHTLLLRTPIRRRSSSNSPPLASTVSFETLAAAVSAGRRRRRRRKPKETMNGGRLSAAEKGKQKAADDADLPPALVLNLNNAGEPRPAADASAPANWHAGGSDRGLPRHLLLVPPSGTSEIEELPPSPPLAPSRPRLPAGALNAARDATALPALAAGLEGRLKAMQAALRKLKQLRREMGSEGSKGADEPPPPEVAGGAEAQALQHQLGAAQARVSGMKDMMLGLAMRFQAEEMQALEEFWKPVVPLPDHQRSNNNSKCKAEEMKAFLEEFWKPVPVPQRNNSKINWNRIISLIGLTSWLVPSIIIFWTLLPVNNLIHIVGAISVLWILRSTYSCCQRFRTSRTISRHVPRLIYVCYCLLLYVLYLILRLIHGAFAGLLGRHQ